MLIADVQRLLARRPFVPFFIVTSNGQRFRVASEEHAGLNPRGTRIHVWFDDESGATIAASQIVALEKEAVAAV